MIARLLLVRADRIGDLMHVTPLLEALRAQEPAVAVDVLARSPAMAVLRGNPGVRRALDARWEEAALRRALEEGAYDAVVHLFPEERLLRLCAPIPRSVRKGWVPWPGRHRRVVLRRSRSLKSEAFYNADLVRPLFPTLRVDPRPRFYLEPGALERARTLLPAPRPVLNPGSGHPEGAWPGERFAQVARRLEPRLGRALIVWGPGEEGLARSVAEESGAEVAPATDLQLLGALAARCAAFVTNDTGPMHIAAAVGAPLVVVWDGSRVIRPRRWGHFFREDIVNLDPFDGTPDDLANRRRRLSSIEPERVAAAALSVAVARTRVAEVAP